MLFYVLQIYKLALFAHIRSDNHQPSKLAKEMKSIKD